MYKPQHQNPLQQHKNQSTAQKNYHQYLLQAVDEKDKENTSSNILMEGSSSYLSQTNKTKTPPRENNSVLSAYGKVNSLGQQMGVQKQPKEAKAPVASSKERGKMVEVIEVSLPDFQSRSPEITSKKTWDAQSSGSLIP